MHSDKVEFILEMQVDIIFEKELIIVQYINGIKEKIRHHLNRYREDI